MKILFYNKKVNLESEEEKDYVVLLKEKYYGLILFIRVLIGSIYAFGLGYNLYYYSENVISNFLISLKYIIIFYVILEFVYILFSSLLLPKPLSDNNVFVNLKLFKSTNEVKNSVSKKRLVVSLLMPFILLALIPSIFSFQYGFNPILYSFLYAATVKSISYIIYSIIIIIKEFNDEILVEEFAYLNIKK